MRLQNSLGGERLKVALEQFSAGRIVIRLRRIPSRLSKQAGRRAIDVVFPRREQLDVAPLPHRMPDVVSSFQHDRPQPALQNMRGSGETNRSGSDNRDGLCFAHGILSSHQTRIIELRGRERS